MLKCREMVELLVYSCSLFCFRQNYFYVAIKAENYSWQKDALLQCILGLRSWLGEALFGRSICAYMFDHLQKMEV
jgi:hypothetical protein